MLVTGSNMSGKTTFLKTIGVNMIFAQTLHFCLAKRFSSSFFSTLTLIGRKDNIIEGKSYYLDEILTLLRIIRASQGDIPCLCLINELFRGTNSVERISASAEVLLYLAKKNGLVFASTHDLELTHLVADAYVNYHFQEEIGEQGLIFNYQLREGPSETRNAIKLLHHVGYPNEITEGAEQRIADQNKRKYSAARIAFFLRSLPPISGERVLALVEHARGPVEADVFDPQHPQGGEEGLPAWAKATAVWCGNRFSIRTWR